MRKVKILIRLRECAGWSECLLGAHDRRYLFSPCDPFSALSSILFRFLGINYCSDCDHIGFAFKPSLVVLLCLHTSFFTVRDLADWGRLNFNLYHCIGKVSRRQFDDIFSFSQKTGFDISCKWDTICIMQFVSEGVNLHVTSKHVLWVK